MAMLNLYEKKGTTFLKYFLFFLNNELVAEKHL